MAQCEMEKSEWVCNHGNNNNRVSPSLLQTQGGHQWRCVVSQAHGVQGAEGVSANRPVAAPCDNRGADSGKVRPGTGPGVHGGLCGRVLAPRHEVDALEERAGKGSAPGERQHVQRERERAAADSLCNENPNLPVQPVRTHGLSPSGGRGLSLRR